MGHRHSLVIESGRENLRLPGISCTTCSTVDVSTQYSLAVTQSAAPLLSARTD
jgi:hypothetical protein